MNLTVKRVDEFEFSMLNNRKEIDQKQIYLATEFDNFQNKIRENKDDIEELTEGLREIEARQETDNR